MARFVCANIRHFHNETHGTIIIGGKEYRCVATLDLNGIDGQNWRVRTTLSDGTLLEVEMPNCDAAFKAMGRALEQWLDAEDRARNTIRGRGIKKGSTVTGEDAKYLSRLSKAALVDLLTESLRVIAGSCDTPLTVDQVRRAISPAMISRGDRLPR